MRSDLVPIFMGESCSRKCEFCCNLTPGLNSGLKRDETYKSVIAQICSANVSNVDTFLLYGGDPLAKPYFNRVCEYLSRFNYSSVVILTNGDLLTQRSEALLKIRYLKILIEVTNFDSNIGITDHSQYLSTLTTTLERARLLLADKGRIEETLGVRIYLYKHIIKSFTAILDTLREVGVQYVEIFLPRFTNQYIVGNHGAISANKATLTDISAIMNSNMLDDFIVDYINVPVCMITTCDDSTTRLDEYSILIKDGDSIIKNISNIASDYGFHRGELCDNCFSRVCTGMPKEYLFDMEMNEIDLFHKVPKK